MRKNRTNYVKTVYINYTEISFLKWYLQITNSNSLVYIRNLSDMTIPNSYSTVVVTLTYLLVLFKHKSAPTMTQSFNFSRILILIGEKKDQSN